jgi:CRP/FNR family transcriptional regulator
MMIDYNVLITYGGVSKKVSKGEMIFEEGASPRFFYQIIRGEVKLFSTNSEGKILMQGIFQEGQSFGESSLLLDKQYPTTAQATQSGVIVRISKENVLNLLRDFPEVAFGLLQNFAEKIYDRASAVQIWVSHSPEEKIQLFLNKHKSIETTTEQKIVPFTRQQIADFTGLRVETVIRTLKKMARNGTVKIVNHKLFY